LTSTSIRPNLSGFDFDVGWPTGDKTMLADYWTILQKQLHGDARGT